MTLRQHGQEIGQLGVAVLLDELRDVVAAAPAAGFAFDERVGKRKSERVWAFSLTGVETPGSSPSAPRLTALSATPGCAGPADKCD